MLSNKFVVPMNGELFNSSILERCHSLIRAQVWEGIDMSQLRIWINNFEEGQERYFAACILDSLIYRSQKQTIAMMQQLFQRVLPDIARTTERISGKTDSWVEYFSGANSQEDPGIRIVPVIRFNDPPTKSGPLLARMYKKYLGLNDKWMIWPWQLEDARKAGINIFLFIDDFLGTGTQFYRFSKHFGIEKILPEAVSIYAPLTAHTQGVEYLRYTLPWLQLCCVENLDPSYSLFASNSSVFNDGENCVAGAWNFYKSILRRKTLRIDSKYTRGYGKLGLTYVFQHATPNNCIPLLWHAAPNWEPLFHR